MSALDDAYEAVLVERQHAMCKTCQFLRELPEDIAESLSRMLAEKRPVKTVATSLTRIGQSITHQALQNHIQNGHPNVRP